MIQNRKRTLRKVEAKVDAKMRLEKVKTVLRELIEMGQPKVPTSALITLLANLDALEIAERVELQQEGTDG